VPSALGLYSQNKEELHATPDKQPSTFGRTTAEETSEEQIRRRAYELYEARGDGNGHDLEDWFEAESEITGRNQRTAA
jgi:hypothetical protein